MRSSKQIRFLFLAAALVAMVAAPAGAAVVVEKRTFDARELVVRNLIGEITVEGHRGSKFEVEITIQGDEASRGGMDIRSSDGSQATLDIVFPDAKTYIYPRLGKDSRSSFSRNDGDGWLGEVMNGMLGRGRIEVRGSGSGVEVWADLTIRVPVGGTLDVRHGVGKATAANVEGDVSLAVRSGHVDASNITGNLVADTGSGHVNVEKVRGNLSIDTGSGHVDAGDIDGDSVSIDTGSGHVELTGARTRDLNIDTGSGRVEARGIETNAATIDTGSGGVTLELTRMGEGNFKIDTGSGGIDLTIPEGASASFDAETGSGGIHVDLGDNVTLERMERDEARFRLGSGAARVSLDTGGGGIRVHR